MLEKQGTQKMKFSESKFIYLPKKALFANVIKNILIKIGKKIKKIVINYEKSISGP